VLGRLSPCLKAEGNGPKGHFVQFIRLNGCLTPNPKDEPPLGVRGGTFSYYFANAQRKSRFYRTTKGRLWVLFLFTNALRLRDLNPCFYALRPTKSKVK